MHRNLEREEPFGMTFAWVPGWITVLVKSRYPTDQQPVTAKDMDKKWG